MRHLTHVIWLSVALAACTAGESPSKNTPVTGAKAESTPAHTGERWYAAQHVSQGREVFQKNCAACHGEFGEGAPEWKKVGSDGKYPAPPLNGTGHAWHHPLKMLLQVVKNGSPGGQGGMPAWDEKLSDDEIASAIAWVQSKWPDQIYAAWMRRGAASSPNRGPE